MSERGPVTKTFLKLVWDYPMPRQPDRSGPTVAKWTRHALSLQDALTVIAGDDPRPLLVLRECAVCNGTDYALLGEGMDNERTFLLSRWFHCVKLPQDVTQIDHPFHSLFAGEHPEHLFVSARDGSGRVPLESAQSRVELWNAMTTVLQASYVQNPAEAMRSVTAALDELDRTDVELVDLEQRLERLLENVGPDDKRVRKLRAQLAEGRDYLREHTAELERRFRIPLKSAAALQR